MFFFRKIPLKHGKNLDKAWKHTLQIEEETPFYMKIAGAVMLFSAIFMV